MCKAILSTTTTPRRTTDVHILVSEQNTKKHLCRNRSGAQQMLFLMVFVPQLGFALGVLTYSCKRIDVMCVDVPWILGFPRRCPRRPCMIWNKNALRSGLGFPTQNPLKSQTCFFTKSVRFGRTELSLRRSKALREILRLGMVSGPVR